MLNDIINMRNISIYVILNFKHIICIAEKRILPFLLLIFTV